MGKIVVIGSSNTDLVIKTTRIPEPGETVIGGEFCIHAGGKGANQAVAAARLGADVVFVAKTGSDQFGKGAVDAYRRDGIRTDFIARDEKAASGAALITVDDAGENCIVVAPGANSMLSEADVDRVTEEIRSADCVLIQLEIPMEVVAHAVEIAHALGVKVILNPAPAAALPSTLISKLYLITPNRGEAALLTGLAITSAADADKAAQALQQMGAQNVIITMGREGALLRTQEDSLIVPAYLVSAMDTTGAGDVFNGALCTGLVEGLTLASAVRFASAASAISVTRMGAQTSAPFRDEVDNFVCAATAR